MTCTWMIRKKKNKTKQKKKNKKKTKKKKTKTKTKQNHTSGREVAVKKMVVVDSTTAGDNGSRLIVGQRSLLVSPSHVVQPLDIW